VLLWNPLLQHLHSVHPDFLVVLAGRIVSNLLIDNDLLKSPAENQVDLSYDLCLARWAMWCVETWDGDESQTDFDLNREVTVNLMRAIGHSITDAPQIRKGYCHFH
jgi:ribosomal biogenesis protein LAS1